MRTADDLLVAWKRWDAHCSKVHADPMNHNKEAFGCPTTVAMEDACQAYAKTIGIECSVLRDRLAVARRAGLSREQSLAKVQVND